MCASKNGVTAGSGVFYVDRIEATKREHSSWGYNWATMFLGENQK
jgi:hypothetical protein